MKALSYFLQKREQKKRMIDESDIEITEDTKSFYEQIKPQLEGLEIFRLEKLKVYLHRKKIGMPAAIILTPICGWLDWMLLLWQRGGDDNAAGITFFVLGAIYWWVTQPKREYAKEYKNQVLPKIAKLLGNLYYFPFCEIPIDQIMGSKIVPKHDKYETGDHFRGTYKGVEIMIFEVDFKQRRRSKNRTYYVSVFKGLAVYIQMSKQKFYGHTMLQENKSKLMEWFKEKSSDLERANLVDPEFEKIFDCYTNDQVEARYLIDPVMIENLKGLHAEYEGETLLAAYYEDKRFLALIKSTHDYFEPADIQYPAVRPETIQNMRNELAQILKIVDKLELYDAEAAHKQAA